MMALAILSKSVPIAHPITSEQMQFAARAALLWWRKIQHRDGSFDEWYRNERSYCATAFTTMAAAVTVSELGNALSAKEKQETIASLNRSGVWLASRWNEDAMNQNAAAAAALLVSAHVAGDSELSSLGRTKLQRLIRKQSPNGWFPEYGGADFGYSTLMLDLLAISHRHGGGNEILDTAASLGSWLQPFLSAHPALPGSIGSRGTSHPFIAGARYFGALIPGISDVPMRLEEGLNFAWPIQPSSIDDRYLAYFYLPQFSIAAHPAYRGKSLTPLTQSTLDTQSEEAKGAHEFRQFFGVDWVATVSPSMGNAFAVARIGHPFSYNLGYELRLKNGQRFSTAHWEHTGVSCSENMVPQTFKKVSTTLPLKHFAAPFHVATGLLGVQALAEPLKAMVRRRLVSSRKEIPVTLRRKVTCEGSRLCIHDEIFGTLPGVSWLGPTLQPATYSPSAKQGQASRLIAPDWDPENAASLISKGQKIDVKWHYVPANEVID